MHVSRDRLSRPVDISSMLQNAQRQVNLVVDVPGLQWKGLSTKKVSTRRHIRTRKSMHRRYVNRSWIDKENQRPRTLQGQGKGKGSILPSWYPRTPLRDITAIVRAIERKRAKLYDDQTTEAAQHEAEASVSNTDQLKNEITKSSSIPQVCKIVDEKGNESDDSSTPQKKLLNSIEQVSQIWLEDRRKFEKTPAAKKAERKERVRVLMSMQ